MGVGDCFNKFCKTFSKLTWLSDVHGLFPLSAKYYDILLFVLGTGCLSQGKRRGKEKSLSKKRVPTNRYVLGV